MSLKSFIKKNHNTVGSIKIRNLIDLEFKKNKFKKLKILEFGVNKGCSTSLFLRFCQQTKSKLISVDTIDCSKLFNDKNWKFIKCRDDEFIKINKIVKWPVDIIFLDTEHTAKHVEKILKLYFNKLKLGGLFIIDDISWLPYIKNAHRDSEWVENNNKETFLKLLEIYNVNKKNFDISFLFYESGLAIIKKMKNQLNNSKKFYSRKFAIKNILRKFK